MKKIFVKSAIVSLFAFMLLLNVTGCKKDVPTPEVPSEPDVNLADQLPIAMHLTDATETGTGYIPIVIIKDDNDPDGNTVKMNYLFFFAIENIKITKSGSILSFNSTEPTVQEGKPSNLVSVTGTYDTKTKQMSIEVTITNTETNETTKQSAISKNVETIPVSNFVGATFTDENNTLQFNSTTSVTLNGTNYILQFEGYDSYYLKRTSNEPTTIATPYIVLYKDYKVLYHSEAVDLFGTPLTTPIYPINNFVNVELFGNSSKPPKTAYTYIFAPSKIEDPTSGTFMATKTPVEVNPTTTTTKGTYKFTRTGVNKYTAALTITGVKKPTILTVEIKSNTNIVIDGVEMEIRTIKK